MKRLAHKNTSNTSRSGFAIFVALGAIVVLSILIFSYNLLVQGKSNERKNILNHTRALKAAQGTARYIFARIKHDLANGDESSLIKDAFISENSTVLANYLNEIDYQKIYKDICGPSLLSQEIEAQITFDDILYLKDKPLGSEVYLQEEKGGYIKLSLTASIDKNKETWEENRPFRVALPFPIGLTKFSLYLQNATNGKPLGFNNVQVTTSSGGGAIGMAPLILDNGSSIGTNKDNNIWKYRGWIYLGSSTKLYMNRADGDTAFGQQYHSYMPGKPGPKAIPELLDGKYDNHQGFVSIGNTDIHVSSARWGFSEQTKKEPSWEQVLNDSNAFNSPPRYYSTWLHLFGDINCTQNFNSSGYRPEERVPSITRVVGDVNDRYMQIAYLATCETPVEIVGAIMSHTKDDFNAIKKIQKPETELFLPSGSKHLKESDSNLKDFRDFFANMDYDGSSTDLVYSKLASGINSQPYHRVYASIVQYSRDGVVDTPPAQTFYDDIPDNTNNNFGLSIDNISSDLPAIDKLSETTDTIHGLGNRITYEIPGGSNQLEEFKRLFYKSNKYNLQNAVVHLKGTQNITLDAFTIESGGTVICDSSITVGEMQKASADLQPLLLMSLNSSITLKGHTEAYLMALSETGGEIKTTTSKLDLFGGVAAYKMPQTQGFLTYNPTFDPLNDNFQKHLGVVIGPEGRKR